MTCLACLHVGVDVCVYTCEWGVCFSLWVQMHVYVHVGVKKWVCATKGVEYHQIKLTN